MMITTFLFVTTGVFAAVADAFTSPLCIQQRPVVVSLMKSAADEYLEKCMTEWNKLEAGLNIVQDTQTMEEAANLAEQMLEKALELVAARKYVEYEHEADARARVKEAVEKEIVAEMNIESAHNDVVMANDEFNLVESYDAEYEDEERRRDLSVLHAAKHIEEDATHSFDEAHKAMDEAMNGVRRTKDTLKSLEENEKALKYALSEFYKLKREYYATHGSEAKQ